MQISFHICVAFCVYVCRGTLMSWHLKFGVSIKCINSNWFHTCAFCGFRCCRSLCDRTFTQICHLSYKFWVKWNENSIWLLCLQILFNIWMCQRSQMIDEPLIMSVPYELCSDAIKSQFKHKNIFPINRSKHKYLDELIILIQCGLKI